MMVAAHWRPVAVNERNADFAPADYEGSVPIVSLSLFLHQRNRRGQLHIQQESNAAIHLKESSRLLARQRLAHDRNVLLAQLEHGLLDVLRPLPILQRLFVGD